MGLVGTTRTALHFFFVLHLHKRGPMPFEIRDELPLSSEPLRMDCLLLRRQGSAGQPYVAADGGPVTLRRLWPMLPTATVMEYKSPARPYRTGDLDRLWAYVHLYFAGQREGRGNPSREAQARSLTRERDDHAAVLVVPKRTPSLDADVASMRLSWEDCGAGYWRLHGGLFALYVVELDVAGPADGDDLLYSLGHGDPTTPEARRFWAEAMGSKEAEMSVQDMEGYDEVVRKFIESLPPEQRLAGMPPEQRLADLDRDHQALALPLDVLRLLPEEYLRSLGPDVQAELRRRLQRNGH